MFNFLRSMLVIVLIALLGYVFYNMATKNANDSKKTLHVSADSTTTIIGTVLTNKNDCLDSGAASKCSLKLRVGAKEVYVIYNANDNSFCINEIAAAAGKTAQSGAIVKVYGFYRRDGDLDTILTCPTKNYFIQTL